MLRKSKQKDTILRILRSTCSHPSADWIYEQARQELPSISLGTVYRNLRLWKEAGEILELDYPGGQSRFDSNPQDHYHSRCERCRKIFDLESFESAREGQHLKQAT